MLRRLLIEVVLVAGGTLFWLGLSAVVGLPTRAREAEAVVERVSEQRGGAALEAELHRR
jgi:hypothetical protein